MLGMKRMCRVRIAKDELDKMSKEDLHRSWLLQEQYIEYIEAKLNENTDHAEIVTLRESKEKLKQQQFESSRKENILVMRLTTKEQEMQDYAAQVQELKQSQIPSISQLRSALLDPAVNLMFDRMRQEIDSLKARLEETQNELNAWKFTPDSVTGKRLMAKCRLLYQENEELGKMISSGKIAKLEGDLALQKSFSDEMKKSQTELDDFLLELDEDLEGLQSTVCFLQQQLRESKEQIEKLQKRNEELSGLSNSSAPNHHTHNENQVELKKSHAPQSCNASSNNGSDVGSSVPPISPDLNRTEGMRSPKSNRGTNSGRPWSPPPPSNPIHNETTDHKHITVKIEANQNPGNSQVDRLSQKQQISPSLVRQEPTEVADNSPITVPPSHGITIPAARGSLHVEEYDSDQDTEPSRATDDSNTFINTTLADNGSQSRVAASPVTKSNLAAEKAQIPTNKRTSENCNNSPNTKGRKRTRSSKSVVAGLNEDGAREPPAVKRLRRREIVVKRDNTESGDCKRTPMEIDSVDNTDTEVEVAKALVNLAVAKKDCKEVHTNSEDLLNETLGNGELLKRKSTIEKA